MLFLNQSLHSSKLDSPEAIFMMKSVSIGLSRDKDKSQLFRYKNKCAAPSPVRLFPSEKIWLQIIL